MSASVPGKVLLVVSGGIAAYKACEVLRALQGAGLDVRVAMTQDAARFVGPATFEGLTGRPAATSLYGYPESAIPHITLAEWADLVLVCPCTANVMAKMAAGIADDLVSTTLLAAPCPVLLAPAMNTHMWANPATQANLATLEGRGVGFVMPVDGRLACGDTGSGKLAAVDEVARAALEVLGAGAQDLAGRRVVIDAGPTHEAIDPVRFIANASTGKMGYAIAGRAARRGADVTIVSGPVSLAAPAGVRVVEVVSAAEMLDAMVREFEGSDCAICTAAVADYTPRSPADRKLKKGLGRLDRIELVETQDILATISARKGRRVVVGFAAETNDLLAYAQAKLEGKGCDLVVANDVSREDSTFGSDTSRVAFVSADGVEQLGTLPLAEVADELLDRVAALLEARP